jgi:hypothetical protein
MSPDPPGVAEGPSRALLQRRRAAREKRTPVKKHCVCWYSVLQPALYPRDQQPGLACLGVRRARCLSQSASASPRTHVIASFHLSRLFFDRKKTRF